MRRNRSRRAGRAEVSARPTFEELKSSFLSDIDNWRPAFVEDADLAEHFVERGWMSIEEAVTKGSLSHWEPFETKPRDEEFDPYDQAFWTLPMAASWIGFRDKAAVRAFMPEVARYTRHWVRSGIGHRLEQALAPTLNDLIKIFTLLEDDRLPSILGDLRNALRQGALTCWAIENSGRIVLGSIDWIDMDFDPSDGTYLFDRRLGRRLQDPRVDRVTLLKLWSPSDADQRPVAFDRCRLRSEPEGAGKVQSALTALRELYPDGLPPGLPVTIRNRRIGEWMQAHLQSGVSDRTIAKAVQLFRARR